MKRRLAFVQLATVSMALRPADTAESEPPKKLCRVAKKELRYLLKRLREADNNVHLRSVRETASAKGSSWHIIQNGKSCGTSGARVTSCVSY